MCWSTSPSSRWTRSTIEVDDLRAQVAVRAEVRELVKLNVGAQARLGTVELQIEGVEAQALLKARLDRVGAIVGRVLMSLDRNPELLESVGQAVEEVGGGTQTACWPGRARRSRTSARASSKALPQVGQGANQALGRCRAGREPGARADRPGRRPGSRGCRPGRPAARKEGELAMAGRRRNPASRPVGSRRSQNGRRRSSGGSARSNGRSASQKPEKYRFAQNVDGQETVAEREYRSYATSDDASRRRPGPGCPARRPGGQGREDPPEGRGARGARRPEREGARPRHARCRHRRAPRQAGDRDRGRRGAGAREGATRPRRCDRRPHADDDRPQPGAHEEPRRRAVEDVGQGASRTLGGVRRGRRERRRGRRAKRWSRSARAPGRQ